MKIINFAMLLLVVCESGAVLYGADNYVGKKSVINVDILEPQQKQAIASHYKSYCDQKYLPTIAEWHRTKPKIGGTALAGLIVGVICAYAVKCEIGNFWTNELKQDPSAGLGLLFVTPVLIGADWKFWAALCGFGVATIAGGFACYKFCRAQAYKAKTKPAFIAGLLELDIVLQRQLGNPKIFLHNGDKWDVTLANNTRKVYDFKDPAVVNDILNNRFGTAQMVKVPMEHYI